MLQRLRQWWYRRNRALAIAGPLEGRWLHRGASWCAFKVPGEPRYVLAPLNSTEAASLLELTLAGKALYPGVYHLDPKSGTFYWARMRSRILTGRRSDS